MDDDYAELRADVAHLYMKWKEEAEANKEHIERVTKAWDMVAYTNHSEGKLHKYHKMEVVCTSLFVLPILKTLGKD